jgi:hypothetical protein
LEPSQKIAGFACRIHAFELHGMVDALAAGRQDLAGAAGAGDPFAASGT